MSEDQPESSSSSWWALGSNVTANLGVGSLSDVTSNLTSGVGSLSNVTSNLTSGVGSLSGVTNNLSSSVGSFWNKAKETGSYVYEFTANDFNEVKTALQQDVLAPSASALKHQLQPHAQYGSLTDTVATMLGNVSEYLAPEPQNVQCLSRYGPDRILAIQTSQDTYLNHKTDEHYNNWCEAFTLEDHTHDISRLLVDNQKLRDLHTFLVPSELSYTNFWKIYYYRSELFEIEKARHKELLSRASKEEAEEELKWSDDEEEDEGKQTETITEQPLSSCTEKTLTPENTVEDGSSDTKSEQPGDTVATIPVTEKTDDTVVTIPVAEKTDDIVAKSPITEEKAETIETESSAVMSDSTDPKLEVSSEEGSYDVIKHKDLESEGELAQSASPQDDEEFEKELDQMIENIDVDDPIPDIDGDGDWEDWD